MLFRNKLAIVFSSALLLVSFIEARDNPQPKELSQPTNILSYPKIKLYGFIYDALFDEAGNLLLMFFRNGLYCVSPSRAYPLARIGQGPGELNSWRAMCLDGPTLAVIETTGRILYFQRTGNIYKYDKTEWIRDLPGIFFKSVARVGNKWFFAGFSYDKNITMRSKRPSGYFLSIFENGQLKKSLLYRQFSNRRYYPHLIRTFLRKFGNQLFLIIETEPKIYVVDPDRLEITKIHELKMPDNYVPIGEETFVRNRNRPVPQLYEEWELSYSRIENILINKDYCLLQFRNPSKNRNKFTLLLLNSKDFSLKNIFYVDDALLAEKDGLYYFLANGDPGLDEYADCLIIKAFSLDK